MAPTMEGIQNIKSQKVKVHGSSPMALCYKENMGWVAEHLGPKSGHWKRITREACEAKPKRIRAQEKGKDQVSLPLMN